MRSRVLAGSVLLLLALGGCSDPGSDDPAEPSGSASSPESSSGGTTAPSPSPSESPTASESPAVTPASGPEVVATDLGEPVLRFRAPAEGDWEVQPGGALASTIQDDGRLASVGGRSVSVVAGEGLDYYVELTREAVEPTGLELERQDDREVAGVEGYVLEGTDSSGFNYYFGAIYDDVQVDVFFRLPRDDAAGRALIESVLASAEWV